MNHSLQQKKAAETNHIHPIIQRRWSPRVFDGTPISEEHISQLFEAARWAPSSNNGQPWRFIFAEKGSKSYDKIFEHLSEFNQKWVKSAPLLILTAYKEQFDNGKENFHAGHDLGQAVAYLTFQAQSLNISLHQMAGVNWKDAQRDFNIPDGFHVTTAIAVGYYGGDENKLSEDLYKQEITY